MGQKEIDSFINTYVQALRDQNAAIFAGAFLFRLRATPIATLDSKIRWTCPTINAARSSESTFWIHTITSLSS